MDYFDAFDEVFGSIERYVAEHGAAPHEIVVAPALYTWLADLQREADMLGGAGVVTDPVMLETPYGPIKIVIDETLSPYEINPQ